MNRSETYKIEYLKKIERSLKCLGPLLSLEELDEIAIILDSSLKKIYLEAEKTNESTLN